MDLWTHSFLKILRHANHVYWCLRMKKLHADGLLESLDYESFDACEPWLMGKMTKTPFSGTMERATDLLEIVVELSRQMSLVSGLSREANASM